MGFCVMGMCGTMVYTVYGKEKKQILQTDEEWRFSHHTVSESSPISIFDNKQTKEQQKKKWSNCKSPFQANKRHK